MRILSIIFMFSILAGAQAHARWLLPDELSCGTIDCVSGKCGPQGYRALVVDINSPEGPLLSGLVGTIEFQNFWDIAVFQFKFERHTETLSCARKVLFEIASGKIEPEYCWHEIEYHQEAWAPAQRRVLKCQKPQ